MPDEAAHPDMPAVAHDAPGGLEGRQPAPDGVLAESGLKGHLAEGDGQHAEVVRVRAGEQVEVQQLVGGR